MLGDRYANTTARVVGRQGPFCFYSTATINPPNWDARAFDEGSKGATNFPDFLDRSHGQYNGTHISWTVQTRTEDEREAAQQLVASGVWKFRVGNELEVYSSLMLPTVAMWTPYFVRSENINLIYCLPLHIMVEANRGPQSVFYMLVSLPNREVLKAKLDIVFSITGKHE